MVSKHPKGAGLKKQIRILLLLVIVLATAYGWADFPDEPVLVVNNASQRYQAVAPCDLDHSVVADVASGSLAASTTGISSEAIKLLSWNIYKGSEAEWSGDYQRLAKGKDIVLLQEGVLDADIPVKLSEQHQFWRSVVAFHYGDSPSGVLTASQEKPLSECGLLESEPLIQVPKSALVSYHAIAGSDQPLLVANVHAINFTLGLGSYRAQFQALTERLKKHQGPMVVAGDFNSWSESRFEVLNEMREALSLHRLDYPNDLRSQIFDRPIDEVFYRQLEPISQQVYSVTSSDHNPIEVTFRLVSSG